METIYQTCGRCGGTGETPTGHVNHWGPVSGVCRDCAGEGVVAVCGRCLGTGIDLDAPVNLASPPPCPCCYAETAAA